MASKEVIRDFLIEMGFDGKKVFDGLKEIEKEFKKVIKSSSKAQSTADKQSSKAQKDKIKSLKDENTLEAKRLNLLKQIKRIKALGGDPSILGAHNTLRSKDPVKIDRMSLSLRKAILMAEEGISKEKDKQKRAAERVAEVERRTKIETSSRASLRKQREAAIAENKKSLDRQRQDAIKSNKASLLAQKRNAAAVMSSERRANALSARRISTINAVQKVGRRADRSIAEEGGLNQGAAAQYQALKRIRAELTKKISTASTAKEFAILRGEISRVNDATTAFIKKNQTLQRDLNASAFAVKGMKDSLRNLARSYVSIFAVIGGAGAAGMTGQDLVALRTTLLAATGSAEEAAKAFEFVRETSLNLGVDLASSTRSFAQMGVAAKMAGLDLQQTQEIFIGLSEASAAFGMSTVDQERAFRAVVQMMS